jgi:hypothetical protein
MATTAATMATIESAKRTYRAFISIAASIAELRAGRPLKKLLDPYRERLSMRLLRGPVAAFKPPLQQ